MTNTNEAKPAAMSSLNRRYAYLNSRGVSLYSMSTDTMLAQQLPKVQAAREALVAILATPGALPADLATLLQLPEHETPARTILQGMVRDLEVFERRLPGARVAANGKLVKVKAKPVSALITAGDQAMQRLGSTTGYVAVEEGQLAGAFLWWDGEGTANVDAICAKLTELGIPEDMQPNEMTLGRILRRALGKAKSGDGRILVRSVTTDAEWCVVRETVVTNSDGSKTLRHAPLLVAYFDGEKQVQFRDVDPDAAHLVAATRSALEAGAGLIDYAALSGWLSGRLVRRHLGGYSLSRGGGKYYISPSRTEEARRIFAGLESVTRFQFAYTPVLRGADVVKNILHGVRLLRDKAIADIKAQLAKHAASNGAEGKSLHLLDTQVAEVREQAAHFEAMFGQPLNDIVADLQAIRCEIASAAIAAAGTFNAEAPAEDISLRLQLVVGDILTEEAKPAVEAAPEPVNEVDARFTLLDLSAAVEPAPAPVAAPALVLTEKATKLYDRYGVVRGFWGYLGLSMEAALQIEAQAAQDAAEQAARGDRSLELNEAAHVAADDEMVVRQFDLD